MQVNVKPQSIYTHEGAKAKHINAEQQLRRSVMACLLWENNFYEDGQSIVDRIKSLIPQVDPKDCVSIALEAKDKMLLRHVPLLIVREMARHPNHKRYVSRTLQRIITRADELAEFLAIYWQEGKCPLSAKVKQGLAFAFNKFSEYELAKYNRDKAVKLRDVLFLSHSKPKDAEQDALYKKLINGELKTPDTWEVALSAGADKKETFERLMAEKKLGALAFIRNLRNMDESKVDHVLIGTYASGLKVNKILPYQFIAAAKTNPQFEPMIEQLLFKCLEGKERLSGHTILLIDVSGSMHVNLSIKSDMTRLDAACGISMIVRELSDACSVFTFSDNLALVPARRGFALRDAIVHSQPHSMTNLGAAIKHLSNNAPADRLIVITDEQSHDSVPDPIWQHAYMINVSTNRNGVGYGAWKHIDGFSASVIDWIKKYELHN